MRNKHPKIQDPGVSFPEVFYKQEITGGEVNVQNKKGGKGLLGKVY